MFRNSPPLPPLDTYTPSHTHAPRSQLVRDAGIAEQDRLRLATLFALRYERDGRPQIAALMQALQDGGVQPLRLAATKSLLKHCSGERRIMDLFGDRTITSRFATLAKQHLKGVENVYTQVCAPMAVWGGWDGAALGFYVGGSAWGSWMPM